ncbi:MAG: prepilin-type N-terminal cleavage/methylation domain-containing protein [Desulfosarcinaceae bacterium]|jgi:prepilin-type N-terminal cleavage/methylation domain-containing protein
MYSQPTANREPIASEAGFSLIELMIAIAIFSIGVLAVASLQVSAIAGNSKGRKIAEELVIAESGLEELMATAKADYNDADLDPAANPHQEVAGAYTTVWNIFMMDLSGDGVDDAKRVQLTVSCNGRHSRSTTLQHIIPQD